jgi:hypothetical protein
VILEVELDAFSGRPNPRWELTGTQAAEFLARLHALQPTRANQFGSEGLGYRGFVVRTTAEAANDFDEVRLYRGTVFMRHRDRVEAYSDPQRTLERWLLDSARGHVTQSVLAYIQSELERQ